MYYSLKTMTFRPNSKSSSDKKNLYIYHQVLKLIINPVNSILTSIDDFMSCSLDAFL